MLILPTYVIGPRNPEGRDFSFLAEASPIASLAPAAQAVAGALPLALSAWSRHGEAGCVAAVPLGDDDAAPLLVMRVAMLGFTDIGRLVYANAVLVDAAALTALDHASERLLDVIPVPDGSVHFGQTALTVDEASLRSGSSDEWPGLGIGWQNRCVLVDSADDAQAALLSALASIDPPAQRQRIRGWASSGGFTRVGGFDPAVAFQLVAMADGAHALPVDALPYRASRSGFSGDAAIPPPSYHRWRALIGLLGFASAGSVRNTDLPIWLRWQFDDSKAEPGAVIERILRGAAGALAGPDVVRLLAMLAASGDDGLADPARNLFWQLIERQTDDSAAAFYPATLVKDHPAAVAPMLMRGWQATRLSPLSHIDEEMLSLMLAHGLLPAIAAHPAATAWIAAAPAGQVVRLGAALANHDATDDVRTDHLLADLSARLLAVVASDGSGGGPGGGPVLAAVIERAAGQMSGRVWHPVERAQMIDAVAQLRPELLTRLSRDWLILGGEHGNRGEGRAGAVALWLRLARTARAAGVAGA